MNPLSLERCNMFVDDGNTVKLWVDKVEVHSGQSFYGFDADKADVRAADYWTRFFTRLENRLNIILIKDGSMNVRRVAAHALAVFDNKGVDYRGYWVSFQKHLVRGIGVTKHSVMLEQELKALIKKYKEGVEK